MHQTLSLALGLTLAFSAIPQSDAPKPTVSPDALTEEQVAVYRAVLEDYSNRTNTPYPLDLVDKTKKLDFSERFFDKECIKGLDLETTGNTAEVVHRLDSRLADNENRIVLVNMDFRQKKIAEGPQRLVKPDGSEIIGGTGLFTFSEIVFDKKHQRAVLMYSFVCGLLCGHGNTMIMKKVGQKWKVGKRCGSWFY
jgi:hypothetical protein